MQSDQHYREAAIQSQLQQNAGSAAFSGALMLIFGWFVYGNQSFPDQLEWFELAAFAFTWTLKLGGLILLLVGSLCYMGWSGALLLDAVVSGLLAVLFLFEGVILAYYRNLEGALLLLFGVAMLWSARTSGRAYRRWVAPAGPPPVESQVADLLAEESRHRKVDREPQSNAFDEAPSESSPGPADKTDHAGHSLRDRFRKSGGAQPEQQHPRVNLDREETPESGFLADLGRSDDQDDDQR